MHICYNANGSYIEPLLISIISILIRTDKYVTFHIISYGGINSDDFSEIRNSYNANFIIYEANDEMLLMQSGGRFPPVTYGRLFIPRLISEDKIIYMDVDTVILEDLYDLWILKPEIILAVYEKDSRIVRKQKVKFKLINYFNSGVMLIDVKKAKNYFDKAILLAKENSYEYLDQDALNVACSNVVTPLDEKFNYMNVNITNINPVVIHFAHLKPWKKICLHSYTFKYTELKNGIYMKNKMLTKMTIKEALKNLYLKVMM